MSAAGSVVTRPPGMMVSNRPCCVFTSCSRSLSGSEMMGNRKVLTATQSNFCAMVASRYGLRKAPARLSRTTKLTAAREVMQRLQKTSDAAMSSQVWPLLRTAIENDPGPFLTYLGIELKAPPKRQKTMTEIFIGKGKGKAKEANPLDFTAPPGSRRLCSVGFAPEPPPFTATNPGDQESSGVNRPYPESLEPALEFAFEGVAGSVAGAVDGLVQDSSNGKCRGQDNVGGQDHDTKPITGHPQS